MIPHIEVDDAQVNAVLDSLLQRLGDLTRPLQKIGDDCVARIALGFNDGRDPWGNAWALLSPVTLALRRKGAGFGSDKPLVNSGALGASFSAHADATSLTVGTHWMAAHIPGGAAIHQFGGQAGRNRKVTITPRPFLPIRNSQGELPEDWRQSAVTMLQRYILEG